MKGDTVIVNFPCVHGINAGEIIKITCFQADELKGTIKTLSGIEEVSATNIIGATRHGENNSAAAKGVMATVSNPNFSGRSYGLALAIADKLARYQRCPGINQLFATGRIEPDGCGDISPIDGLKEKTELVIERVKKGDMFVFPAQIEDADIQLRKLLKELADKGATSLSVSNMNQLNEVLWCTKSRSELRTRTSSNWLKIGVISALILLTVSVGVYFSKQKGILANEITERNPVSEHIQRAVGSDSMPVPSLKIEPVSVPTNAY